MILPHTSFALLLLALPTLLQALPILPPTSLANSEWTPVLALGTSPPNSRQTP